VIQIPEGPEDGDIDLGPAAAQRDPASGTAASESTSEGLVGVRQDCRNVGSEVNVLSENGSTRPARIVHIQSDEHAMGLVAVDYLDDIGGSEVGLPLARISIEVEADHTGVVDSPQTTTTAASAALAGLAAAADALPLLMPPPKQLPLLLSLMLMPLPPPPLKFCIDLLTDF
jgi:hypothetical protein